MTSDVAQKAPEGGPDNSINHNVRAADGDIIMSLIIDFVEPEHSSEVADPPLLYAQL
jgi:hypothetical protein